MSSFFKLTLYEISIYQSENRNLLCRLPINAQYLYGALIGCIAYLPQFIAERKKK